MDFASYYRRNVTYVEHEDFRLNKIAELVQALRPTRVLDIGCGTGWLAEMLAARAGACVVGLDVLENVRPGDWEYVVADVTRPLPLQAECFDCVVAGEVLEHVPNPDRLLTELHRVLKPRGHLVVSTPNMVSWANRVLVPLGIQPLGTETSTQVALGRRLRILGQGNTVQGHLKLFTHRSLEEILERYSFRVLRRYGMPAEFPPPLSMLDRLFANAVPLASDLLYVAQAREYTTPPAAPTPSDPRRGKDFRLRRRRGRE